MRIEQVVADRNPPLLRYEPGSPDADAKGYVAYPNVNPVAEMVDLMAATRAYEANLRVLQSFRQMAEQALQLARG